MGQNSIGKHGLWLIILIMEIGLNSIGIMDLWIKHGLWMKFTNVQIGSHCIIQACHGAMAPCPPLSDRAKVLAVREVPFGRFGHQRLGRLVFFSRSGGGMCPTVLFLTENGCETGIDDINIDILYGFYMVYYGLPRRPIQES